MEPRTSGSTPPGVAAGTFRLALIGDGIDKSLAPAFHVMAGQLLGLDVTYELLPQIPAFAEQLDTFLVELAEGGYRGVNITVPFKSTAWRRAARPDPSVVTMGVANTLLLGPEGPTDAYNTDFSGFKWAYRRRFGSASPGSVALLGAGGVGTATATALVDLGAAAVRIFDIVPERSRTPRQFAPTTQRGRRDLCGDVGSSGGRRRRRCGQRHAGRDVPAAGLTRRPGGDRRTALDLRRHLLAGRDHAHASCEPRPVCSGSADSTCSSARRSTPSRCSPASASPRR